MTFAEGVEFLSNFVTGPMSVLLVFVLSSELKYSVKRTAIITASAVGIIFLGNLLITAYFGYGRMAKELVSLLNVLIIAVLIFSMNRRGGRICFILFTAAVFSCMGNILGEIIGGEDAFARLCLKFLFITAIIIVSGIYIRSRLLEMLEQIEEGWYKMTMIPLSLFSLCLIMLFSAELYHDMEYKVLGIFLCFAILCIYVSVYYNFTQLRKQYEVRAAYSLLEAQLGSLQERAGQLRAGYDKMAIYRHDMRHYMRIQEAYLKNGDVKGAEDILKSMTHNLDEIADEVRSYTGILILDTVLTNYAKKTEEAGGLFEVSLEQIESAAMDTLDLAVVLSNGLENAWHACLEIQESASKVIKITGRKKYNQYFLEIANRCSVKAENEEAPTIHENGMPEHGYGMQSIKAFAVKHNAYLDYKIEEDWFRLRMILCKN